MKEIEHEIMKIHYKRTYWNLKFNIWYIVHNEGFFALWKGMAASMLGISHVVIYFPLYERLKAIW